MLGEVPGAIARVRADIAESRDDLTRETRERARAVFMPTGPAVRRLLELADDGTKDGAQTMAEQLASSGQRLASPEVDRVLDALRVSLAGPMRLEALRRTLFPQVFGGRPDDQHDYVSADLGSPPVLNGELTGEPAPESARQSGAECSGDPSGRIAFRLRIGVTGHRKLSQVPRDCCAVQTELTRLVELTAADGLTIIELAVISQLAEGADRLVVDEVLSAAADRGRQARLEAVLPMHRDSYASAQGFTAASQREFDALVEQASLVIEPRRTVDGDGGDAALAYETAGRGLITRCDVLIAIWDGQPTGGGWGTAETLLAAASEGNPCVWIPTNPKESIQDNLMPGTSDGFRQLVGTRAAVPSDCARPPQVLPKDALKPLRESLAPLQHFNRARLPAEFGGRLRDEFGFPGGEEDWIAPVFLRADVLAAKNQVRFAWSVRAVSLLAITAAVMLGVHLSLSSSPHGTGPR